MYTELNPTPNTTPVYRNDHYQSNKWVSLGVYALNGYSYVYLTDASQEVAALYCAEGPSGYCRLKADAVKFVQYTGNLPNPPTITPTPTRTRTPSVTPTPTVTRTPTPTLTPTGPTPTPTLAPGLDPYSAYLNANWIPVAPGEVASGGSNSCQFPEDNKLVLKHETGNNPRVRGFFMHHWGSALQSGINPPPDLYLQLNVGFSTYAPDPGSFYSCNINGVVYHGPHIPPGSPNGMGATSLTIPTGTNFVEWDCYFWFADSGYHSFYGTVGNYYVMPAFSWPHTQQCEFDWNLVYYWDAQPTPTPTPIPTPGTPIAAPSTPSP